MGKVKVKIVGDTSAEQEQIEEQKKKREQKNAEKKNKVKGVGLGGGERINSIGVSEEDILAEVEQSKPAEKTSEETEEKPSEAKSAESGKAKKAKSKKVKTRVRSKRHEENKSHIAKSTLYPVKNGIEILRKFKNPKFDETVELHINVKEKGISGQVVLPHGTGKELRIKIADDALIAEVEGGKIDFDVLVAQPAMMPKLARVAKILGPRGLMPNPKAGTIAENTEVAVKKLSGGQIAFKTEAGGPVIHMRVGKASFKDDQLEDNIKTVLLAIGASNINSIILKSTMSPGIRIQV